MTRTKRRYSPSEEDVFYLRLSEEVPADEVGDLLKTWRGIVFDHRYLRAYDENPKTHEVDPDYAMLSSSCRSLVNPRQRIYRLKSRLAFL